MSREKSKVALTLAIAVAWGMFANTGQAAAFGDEAASVPLAVDSVQYIGDGQGWASDGRHVLLTRDQGNSWGDITPVGLRGPIEKIHFVNAKVGVMVSSDEVKAGVLQIQTTADGGASWSSPTMISLPVGESVPQVLSLSFTDAKTGWLMVQLPTSVGPDLVFLYRTGNGGSVWQQLPQLPAAGVINFTSAKDGRLSAGDRQWQTHDGGESWQAAGSADVELANLVSAAESALSEKLTADEQVIDVQYDDANRVWAVVLGGFCETESNCTQYSRLWAVDKQGVVGDITPQVTRATFAGLDGADYLGKAPIYAPKALPGLAMTSAVIQAQVEPRIGHNLPQLASDVNVRMIQSALTAHGISTAADGHYGYTTTNNYSTWQRRLGYSGMDANGIPGPSSLAALGRNRFVVTNKIILGGTTTVNGKRVSIRTRNMLLAAQRLLGRTLRVVQGGYCRPNCAALSAGTHDWGGAVDISVSGMSSTTYWKTVKALRQVGFAAWYRPRARWEPHIHAVAIGDTDVAHIARDQIADYWAGRNGLSGHAADNTPSAYRVPFTWWERSPYFRP